ncbi:glycoside hydrolase family 18 protein [Proteiniphilum acetatigenes]|uniref:glycoside hydrolase family 18 protein n=1 Tax=Proteiniphilum acetatigenes TaxID=294710 RepID=UPI00047754B1|nr:glycosyl hydrolase family 18 protein [Proteiniphilum acetatigenes]SFK31686.1 chitinase [Porphyromonadaceae bacterium KH3CP3RA]
MKQLFFSLLIVCSCICFYSYVNKPTSASMAEETAGKLGQTPVVLAYVVSGSEIMPDPNYVTHINYAFGHVNNSFDGIQIQNEPRLKQITGLKEAHPHLKIMLSIGGWTSGRFSEMAADDVTRDAFAKDCQRVIDEFNLDGIDMDWEYPTSSAAGISSSPQDMDNFTSLMKEIRNYIGDDKLLTFASAYNAKYYDFKAVDPYIDFVNIMTYDMGRPPYHNSPLHRSEFTRSMSIEESVQAHVDAGVPLNKLTLGIPFYGHAIKEIADFIDYKDIHILDADYTLKWDSLGGVPYYVDDEGKFICSFDNPESAKLKCEFAKKKEMLGVMYWEYTCDDANGTLRKITYETMYAQ